MANDRRGGGTAGSVGRACASWLAPVATAVWMAGCSTPPTPTPSLPAPSAANSAAAEGQVVGRSERVLIYLPEAGENWNAIAARFLGDGAQGWQVAEANPSLAAPQVDTPLAVPLVARNPLGVWRDGVQGVTVLCYHRVGPGSGRMNVSAARFAAQMQWLADNGYHVVSLSALEAFLAGNAPLPRRSVVLTFDDGYRTVYRHAWPVLRRMGYPATLFIYTDFIGSHDALTTAQMREMRASGLIDIQAHSKSHRNLTERSGDSAAYLRMLTQELREPQRRLAGLLASQDAPPQVHHFAYPYGDANEAVLAAMARQKYTLGLTVDPGSTRFYSAPLMLRRVMVYGDYSLDQFRLRVQGQVQAIAQRP